MFFRTKEVPPQTLAEKYNDASATHAAAVTVFVDIAADLRDATLKFEEVAAEAQEEITRLAHIRDEAVTAADNARKSTEDVLSLTRGIPV